MGKKKGKRTLSRAEALKRRQRNKLIIKSFFAAAIVMVAIIVFNNLLRGSGSVRGQGGVDIDFTIMSDTMVYAALLNVMRNAINHEGQTIRIRGSHQVITWGGDYRVHFVVVQDQTGCCPQRMEFRRSGNYVFPDDYPPDNVMIELTGVFTRGEHEFYLSINDIRW